MQQRDFPAFSDLLDDVWGLKGQPLTAGQKAMFFRAMAQYPLIEVRAGLDAHVRDPKRGQFLPMPADVIAQINGMVADDGRPGAEEAWAVAYWAMNEAATVVWTDEMAEAFGLARPLLLAGDEVAARMAFKEAYTRILADARERRVPPRWTATLGFDKAEQASVLQPHIAAGRIAADMLPVAAIGLDEVLSLPAPEGAIEAVIAAAAAARARLRELRDEIAGRGTAPTHGEVDLQRTARLKARAAASVANYLEAPQTSTALR